MTVGALLALQYSLFWFSAELSEPQRRTSLAEAMALTVLLALCIVALNSSGVCAASGTIWRGAS